MSVYNRVDSVFIERILTGDLGEQQVGVYAHAFRILDAANQIALLFAVLLLPIYSRMIRLGQSVVDMVRLPFSILFAGGIVLAVGSYFYSSEIMQLLYPIQPGETPEAYASVMQQSATIYGLLMFCFLATSTMYVFSTLLTANGSLKQLNLVALIGILVNFTLNIVLIPKMMATGSAIASLVTQAVTATSHILLVQWYFKFKVNWRYLGVLAFYAFIVILLSYLSRMLPYHWLVNLGLVVVVAFAIAFATRLVSLRSIWLIVKSREE
jgi:O-antigen/teichoic acid export membrane protein